MELGVGGLRARLERAVKLPCNPSMTLAILSAAIVAGDIGNSVVSVKRTG